MNINTCIICKHINIIKYICILKCLDLHLRTKQNFKIRQSVEQNRTDLGFTSNRGNFADFFGS